MQEKTEERAGAFTETLLKVVGTGLPGETIREIVGALALRFALKEQQVAATTVDAVPVARAEQVQEEAKPAEQQQEAKPATTDGIDPPAGKAWQEAVKPLGTPWADDAAKPVESLTDGADPT